jgi:hypothetical protein
MPLPETTTMQWQWRSMLTACDIAEMVTPESEFLFYAGAGSVLAALGEAVRDGPQEGAHALARLLEAVDSLNVEITNRSAELMRGNVPC